MEALPTPPHNTRMGIHYFPDSLHYRDSDLAIWLPELHCLGTSWIVLQAPLQRAIPEAFLRGLITGGMEPVLQFSLSPGSFGQAGIIQSQDLRLLCETYAKWGVHYVALFDRPNLRQAWPASAWTQPYLVERFLDLYLPLAQIALDAGLYPVFPPLEPGGDFWDTAFLRLALQGMLRRGQTRLLDRLILGAYAWSAGRPLQWGAGGPERWPAARPYYTPPASQDQRGFRIFDWYLAIAQAALNKSLPLLILAGGSRVIDYLPENTTFPAPENIQPTPCEPIDLLERHARTNATIATLLLSQREGMPPLQDPVDGSPLEPAPEEVLACNFWLLSASPNSPHMAEAWFQSNGRVLPVVSALRQMTARRQEEQRKGAAVNTSSTEASSLGPHSGLFQVSTPATKPIDHYLLLPAYEWGVSDWHLDIIRPFVKKHHPAIGFSLDEACNARRVTVVGGLQPLPAELLDRLRQAGCEVQQVCGGGTEIATELARL